MRIILFGPPGSGKGTQSQFITKKYGIPKISSGDLLRVAVQSGSQLGKLVKKVIEAGDLVTDELITRLVKRRIMQEDCQTGFLLDGFPRTIAQARFMREEHISIEYVIELDIPDDLIIERITGRLVHIPSGRAYHSKFNSPKVEGKDDITNETLSRRRDDKEEIVRKRLIDYRQLTVPVINYYKQKAKQNNTRYEKIDGTKSIADIYQTIKEILS